jgi:exopolysaccharide biosynthesis protein
MTQYPGITGMRILEMMEHYDAVAAVNASGFQDPNENGNGGEVVGMSLSEGHYWGEYAWHYGSIVLTNENKLVVGNIRNWDQYGNIRDGMQFSPVLIADGKKQVSGTSGYGVQPRTAVGQREDGVIVFIVIDGRDITHSFGCTVDDLAEELLKYGVINASSCDGGATTALAYKGKVLNKNCSLHPDLGRILPNAFMVRSKADTED